MQMPPRLERGQGIYSLSPAAPYSSTLTSRNTPLIFRPSRKLATKIKVGKLAPLPPDEDPLADWSSHLFVADRVQYILLSHTTSLYSAVLYGRGITDVDGFLKGALFALKEALEADGLGDVYRRHILPAASPVRFAGASGRAVTGSMNELIAQAKWLLADEELSPFDLGLRLNEILLSAIGGGGKGGYSTPRAALRAMLEGSVK